MSIEKLLEKFLGESIDKSEIDEDDVRAAIKTLSLYEYPEDVGEALKNILIGIAKAKKEASQEPDLFPSVPLPELPENLTKADEDEILVEKIMNPSEKDAFPSIPVPTRASVIEKIRAKLEKADDDDDDDEIEIDKDDDDDDGETFRIDKHDDEDMEEEVEGNEWEWG